MKDVQECTNNYPRNKLKYREYASMSVVVLAHGDEASCKW